MGQVKLTITLSESDVAALDRFAHAAGLNSRSAAIQQAIRQLPDLVLEDAHADAWSEWESSDEARWWEATAADGLTDAAR